jgi:EmrB/QacA subfamily drug resistance transporter
VIGGALVGAASWRWIFFVNLPVGAVAVFLAVRLLPDVPRRAAPRLDVKGLVLLSGGIATLVFGLAQVGQHGSVTAVEPLAALVTGGVLLAGFVVYALRSTAPIIDLRLFARRGFATAALTNLVLGSGLFGVALLLPLYFQIVRGRSPLETGLLLVPQGAGAAVAIAVAGAVTDKVGARRVVPVGVVIAAAGTATYTQIGAKSPYWYLAAALFAIGAGLGATISPSFAAAFEGLEGAEIGRASSAINVVQRVAGSFGTALLAVVLQRALDARLPGADGVAGASAAMRRDPVHAGPAIAHAFGIAFWVALCLTAAGLVTAVLLPSRREVAR